MSPRRKEMYRATRTYRNVHSQAALREMLRITAGVTTASDVSAEKESAVIDACAKTPAELGIQDGEDGITVRSVATAKRGHWRIYGRAS